MGVAYLFGRIRVKNCVSANKKKKKKIPAHKSKSCGYSFESPQQIEAIQMNATRYAFYKENQ